MNLLAEDRLYLNYNDFGYKLDEDDFIPERVNVEYPSTEELVPNCNCKKCFDTRCNCRASGIPCIYFVFVRKMKLVRIYNKSHNLKMQQVML